MDNVLENIMKALEQTLQKEGKILDANTKKIISENIKAQFLNLPEEKRNELLGLISTQLKV
jgi:hypothetical protein